MHTRLSIIFSYVVLFTTCSILYLNIKTEHSNSFPGWEEVKGWIERLPGPSGDLGIDYCFYACSAIAVICFLTGEVTGNWSQVDKLWSLIPVMYTWILVLVNPNPRLWLMTIASSAWGIRLTYNFVRRGGYGWPPWTGEEDYRWNYVRKWPVVGTKLGGSLFNLLFICLYQNILLFLTASPAVICSKYVKEVSWEDYMLTVNIIMLVYIEFVSDQQQYDFQTEKWAQIKSGKKVAYPFSIGFPCHELFSVSRHPNYTAEMSIWFVFYLYTVSAGAGMLNWSLSGAVLLALLFQGSTLLSESITANKYPLYARYKKEVPRFLGAYNPLRSSYPPALLSK